MAPNITNKDVNNPLIHFQLPPCHHVCYDTVICQITFTVRKIKKYVYITLSDLRETTPTDINYVVKYFLHVIL